MARDDMATAFDPSPDRATLMVAARNVLAARRALQEVIPADLVANPALELLVSLFVADAGPLSEDEAVHAATVSPAVAARWIAALETEGLVGHQGSAVALTDTGRGRVADMLRAMIRSQAELPTH